MTRPARNTATRDRHRRYIRRTKPPCALCKQPIDYTLHYRDPMAYVVDHIIPIARGGDDNVDNIQAAHRLCNETKGAKLEAELVEPQPLRAFTTTRTW